MDNPLDRLTSLDLDRFALVYAISKNIDQAKDLERVANKHRSTTLKYLNELKREALIQIRIKPGTEKKYRPTYTYRLAPQVTHEDIVLVAQAKGVDIQKIVQERHGLGKQISIARTPQSTARTIDVEEQLNRFDPLLSRSEEMLDLVEENKLATQSDLNQAESLESPESLIIKKMAMEIVELKARVAKLEESNLNHTRFNVEEILRILDDE